MYGSLMVTSNPPMLRLTGYRIDLKMLPLKPIDVSMNPGMFTSPSTTHPKHNNLLLSGLTFVPEQEKHTKREQFSNPQKPQTIHSP